MKGLIYDVDEMARIMHAVFVANGFTWIGNVPSEQQIADSIREKISDLLENKLLSVSSGRIRVHRDAIGGYVSLDIGCFDVPEDWMEEDEIEIDGQPAANPT